MIFPVGSVEEHGNHLPLCADSLQPDFVALEVAKRTGCLVLPPLYYGVCPMSRNFPGTLSISFGSLYRMTRDILNELIRNGFLRILVLSGHAESSHMVALRLAAQKTVLKNRTLNAEGKLRIMVLSDYDFAYELRGKYVSEKDGHAGDMETSRVMAIKPSLVKPACKANFSELPRFDVVANPENYFPNGFIGDPREASASKGRKINKYVIEQVTKLVESLQSTELK